MTELLTALSQFYRSKGIHPLDFRCPNRSSCAQGAVKFTEARSALVGTRYGDPVRIVILSLDPGLGWPDPNQRTLEGYRKSHSETRIERLPKNRHWYRTIATVAELISSLGFQRSPEEAFHCFAHVNAAKCTLNLPRNRQAPQHLFDNCRGFLAEELALLEPDVVVTQGRKSADALATLRNPADPNPSLLRFGSHDLYWIQLAHPTARGDLVLKDRTRWPRIFSECRSWLQASGRLPG